jgi:radical SAM protein with 4Fe4S-binding SPASM domain
MKIRILKRIRNKIKRPNHTWKRFINSTLNFISKSVKSPYVFGLPESIFIEPTNTCNLKCPLCPTGSGKMKRRKGFLSFENFKKIIDEIGDYIYYLTLTNYGEPFLNKDILKIISYAKSKKIIVSILTNAQLIDRLCAAGIVDAKLDNIVISMDGSCQTSYEKYRVGGELYKVIEAIKLIREERVRKNSELPSIHIQFIVMKHNENEIQEIKDLVKDLKADKLVFKKLCNLSGFPGHLKDMESYIPNNPDYNAYKIELNSIKWNTSKQDKNWCDMAWNYPAINWDGSLSPCCFDCESYFNLGNVFESSFKNVWNGKKFISLRRNLLKDKSSIPICSNCPVNFYEDIIEDVVFK